VIRAPLNSGGLTDRTLKSLPAEANMLMLMSFSLLLRTPKLSTVRSYRYQHRALTPQPETPRLPCPEFARKRGDLRLTRSQPDTAGEGARKRESVSR
jgi:hypothetical protein